MKLKTIFYLAPRLGKFVRAACAMRNQELLPTPEHLRLCAAWLLYSQNVLESGGYSASYSLITGLRHAYIETTGYIIPTMLDLGVALKDPRCRASAVRAGEWLLKTQMPDGSFTDIDEFLPQVFDTGQVMFGLNRMFRETQDPRYLEAARRAADWLVRVQDADGSWTRAGYYRGRPCVYLARVAAALLETFGLTGDEKHRTSAVKFLRWAATRQQANGFFQNCELKPDADPVLHTMVYVLEGYLMAWQQTGEKEWLEILLRGARPLRAAQLERDLFLRSQYNADFAATNPQACIPGLAQWAGLCLHLHKATAEDEWLEAARLTIYYLKSKQVRGTGILEGALPASVPLWGYYHPMKFPNWTVKFFADALLLYDQYDFALWQDQELWVAKCFALQLDGGAWRQNSTRLEPFDELMCGSLRDALVAGGVNAGKVLDLGCGEGRYLDRLKELLPNLEWFGADPQIQADNGHLRNGSAYKIPFPDGTFDAVYSFAVFQHLHEPERALAELRRVLKPGGLLLIGDRDLHSGRGLLKPYHELRGRWMYPWDSPFRERWYSPGAWKRILRAAEFKLTGLTRLTNPGEQGWRRLVRMNAFLLLSAIRD